MVLAQIINDLKESQVKIDEEIERCKEIITKAEERILTCEVSVHEVDKLLKHLEYLDRTGY